MFFLTSTLILPSTLPIFTFHCNYDGSRMIIRVWGVPPHKHKQRQFILVHMHTLRTNWACSHHCARTQSHPDALSIAHVAHAQYIARTPRYNCLDDCSSEGHENQICSACGVQRKCCRVGFGSGANTSLDCAPTAGCTS